MKKKVKAYFLNIEKADSAAGRIRERIPGVCRAVAHHTHPTHFWNTVGEYYPILPASHALLDFQAYPDGVMSPYAISMLTRDSDRALLDGGEELGSNEAVLEIELDDFGSTSRLVNLLINEGAYSIKR